jgi:myosin heavy subunit
MRKGQMVQKDKLEEHTDLIKSLSSNSKASFDNYNQKFNETSNVMDKKLSEIEGLIKQIEKHCLLEIQNIKNSELKAVNDRLSSLQQEIMLAMQGFQKIETKFSQVNQRVDNSDSRINNYENKYSNLENKLAAIDKKVHNIDTKLMSFEGELSKINIKETQISLLDNKVSTHEMKIKECEQLISENSQQLSQCSSVVNNLQRELDRKCVPSDSTSDKATDNASSKTLVELCQNVRSLSNNMKAYDAIIKQVNPQLLSSELSLIKQSQQEQKEFTTSLQAHINAFIDEHAHDKKIRFSTISSLSGKMDIIEWWLRYSKYISINASSTMCDEFLSLGMDNENSAFAKEAHESRVMQTFIFTLSYFKTATNDKLLLLYSKILEELLYNNQNYDNAIEAKLAAHLYDLLATKVDQEADTEQVRYIVRCIIFCMRDDRSKSHIVQSPQGLTYIMKTIESYKDNEIIANSMKIIKLCFKLENLYASALNQSKNSVPIILKFIEHAHYPPVDALEDASLKEATGVKQLLGSKIYI